MAVLLIVALATVALLSDDRPRTLAGHGSCGLGEPAAFPADPRRPRARLGLVVRDRGLFARLLIPGFLISVGAGQVIPFLNLFIQRKFGLDLTALNAVFALTSLGTVAAILAQPRLARRFGQITSVVIVQGASIPFLVVLGFSPVLWTVVVAMAVRNSLMNAGNPIFTAFAMERVTPAERATLSAAMSVLWQVGWVIGGIWYAVAAGHPGLRRGLHGELRHDHHALLDRDSAVLGLVPARRPGACSRRASPPERRGSRGLPKPDSQMNAPAVRPRPRSDRRRRGGGNRRRRNAGQIRSVVQAATVSPSSSPSVSVSSSASSTSGSAAAAVASASASA